MSILCWLKSLIKLKFVVTPLPFGFYFEKYKASFHGYSSLLSVRCSFACWCISHFLVWLIGIFMYKIFVILVCPAACACCNVSGAIHADHWILAHGQGAFFVLNDPVNYFTFFYSSTKGSISYMRDISILKLDYELRYLNYAPYINLTLYETFWKSIYRLGGSE